MVTLTLRMPRLGETMEEGRIAGWLVAEGESFRRGESLLEVETDKTVVEFPALGNGRLVDQLAQEGAMLAVGAPLARVEIIHGADWPDLVPDESEAVGPGGPETGHVVELKMPRLGETMEEGRIVQWLISPGSTYRRGEAIVEIETDKTLAESPALDDGRLIEILRGEGEMVAVGAPIARVALAAGEAVAARPHEAPSPEPAAPPVPATEPASAAVSGTRRRATPLARRIARRAGLSLDAIAGNGPRGRIEKSDVLAAADGAEGTSGAGRAELLERDGARLAYSATGPAEGAPVLLIHGFAADRTIWAGLASALSRDGRRVIAPDLPGHGETTLEAGEVAALGAPLYALLDAATPGRAVEVIAHSLGAAAAVELAARHPGRVAGLTLISPAGLGLAIDDEFVRGMAGATGRGEVLHLLRRISETGTLPSSEAAAKIAAEVARGRLTRLAADAVGPLGQRVDIVGQLAEIARAMPVRVIVGLSDRVIPWEQVTALPPLVAVHLIAGAGHMPHWDRPREVLEILERALGGASG